MADLSQVRGPLDPWATVRAVLVVLALNASAEGDATSHYISQQLTPLTKVSELARGLPVGADLDLADRVTLSHAFAGRSSL